MAASKNRYARIIEKIFLDRYREGKKELSFSRTDIVTAADDLELQLPKNLGDLIYSFRYRAELPKSISEKAKKGFEWIIRSEGPALYSFQLVPEFHIAPRAMLVETKIPDATPGIINKYSLSDEQSLLAIIRYNRLIDIFTGLTCYSLQSHLRTTVPGIGQVETDELYIGIDKRGVHYVLPIQAKGSHEKVGRVQIEQDFALCKAKFPNLIAKPVAAQFMDDRSIALFEMELAGEEIKISSEKHYRFVSPDELTPKELDAYRQRQF